MPSDDREESRDRDLVRHSQSFSSFDGKLPMWDSSDPDRAPPPLPLNPGSPVLTTRHNTSAVIANAAKALEEKARESMPASSYTTNAMTQRSPERSLIKGAQHKRMQSMQTSGVRDLRSYLDSHRSPDRSPERPSTRSATPLRDLEVDTVGGYQGPPRLGTPTPSHDLLKDTPALRPSARAILGENTPPSATMMALQTMTVPPHLMDPTAYPSRSSSPKSSQPPAQTFDAISNQLLSITTIVSNLQKDMTQLSRRSKDNATDLVGLKEATSQRDEDIRHSLKDLLATMNQPRHTTAVPGELTRSTSNMSLKDPHMTPTKQFTLPRIASPNSFMLDERIGSPNPYSVEGAASVAMLEKIIREMVTKDGQERLLTNLQKIVDHATGETAKKVTDLVEFVKQSSANHALVPTGTSNSTFMASTGSGPLMRTTVEGAPLQKVSEGGKPYTSPKAADFVSDEMLKFLRKIKDSVTESGCVTMGNKAILQDLRGEVLGMGREIARKLEHAATDQPASQSNISRDEMGQIIQEGLADLKEHMDKYMRERRRQSTSSIQTRNTVDSTEIYDIVKHTLAQREVEPRSQQSPSLDRDAILSAVRDAYEDYKPNLEIQQFGLERDEILLCLREGLQEYRASGGVTREEIERIIQDSLQDIKLPPPINEAHEVREEVLMAVRECLDDLKPSISHQRSMNSSLSRDMVLETMQEALAAHHATPQVLEISEEVLFQAVKEGLQSSNHLPPSDDAMSSQRLQSVLDKMHAEFKAYSSANGRDTEQVLDALHDGLDHLRAQIESYVDKAQDVTHKDEIVDTMTTELDRLRIDIQGYLTQTSRNDRGDNSELISCMKSEFEKQLEQIVLHSTPANAHKDDILKAVAGELDEIKSRTIVQDPSVVHVGSLSASRDDVEQLKDLNEEVLTTVKEEFGHLRGTLAGSLVRSGGANQDDMIDAFREMVDNARMSHEHLSTSSTTAIQANIDALKASLSNTMISSNESIRSGEVREMLRSGIEDIKAQAISSGVNEELLEAFRGELEQVRQSNDLTRQHGRADAEEVLEAVRLGLDDLRAHMEKKLNNSERYAPASEEVIDALNDGLESMRVDVIKTLEKPIDMTISYEILDTLKAGLAGLREEISKGRTLELVVEEGAATTGHEVVLAEDPDQRKETASRGLPEESITSPTGFDKMQVMLTQLQIKIEAIDAHIQDPVTRSETVRSADSQTKADLFDIEELLKDIQASVLASQDRELNISVPEGLASKEDTDAIEILLGNMKAKLDELTLANTGTATNSDSLDELELVSRTTAEALAVLAKKFDEEGATKADVATVQVIADDIKAALDEMKSLDAKDDSDPRASKSDIDAVCLLVDEVKVKLNEMKVPSPEELPSKADVEQLTGLVHDFRESHDKLRDQYEEDIKRTAAIFDDRKKEAEDLTANLTDVKLLIDDFRTEVKVTLVEGKPLESLRDSFTSLEESIGANCNITADVKDLIETVAREFDRAHGSIEALQNDQAEKSALHLEKHDEVKDAIVNGLFEKIDGRFDTLMVKYDDAQLLADEQAKVMKEKAEEQEKILDGTKAMAEELRLTLDTLGASITAMNDRFEVNAQKIASESISVHEKIETAVNRIGEQGIYAQTEHAHTRDEIKNIERIFNGFQDSVTEYHPKFMVALREIQALVTAHYDHAQKTRDEAEANARSFNEESRARTVELQKHFSSLPALLPAPAAAIELPEQYNDARVQEKLDQLLGRIDNANPAVTHLERLDGIHAQVQTTSAALSDFISKQTQLITNGQEAKEREAEELALVVARRTAQRDQLDGDIELLRTEKEAMRAEMKLERACVLEELKEEKERAMQELKEEKDSVLAVVAALQAERENLANQKVRLTGEVSSLHTALEIRREELHLMDVKADTLERRILNGIMDHSRALMMTKGTRKAGSKSRSQMDPDEVETSAKRMPPPSMAADGLALALKNRPAFRRSGQPPNPASRRIHSLSQISGNTPTGAQGYSPPVSGTLNAGGLKRSHSVKTNYARKSSWNGRPCMAYANKENEAFCEEDENITEQKTIASAGPTIHEDVDDEQSEAGTERRRSYGTGSDYTYASGSSYMTGSDVDRRTSYGSQSRISFHDTSEVIDEASEEDSASEATHEVRDDEPTQKPAPSTIAASEVSGFTAASDEHDLLPTQSEVNRAVEAVKQEMKDEVRHYMPNDSGVGSELPTAAFAHETTAGADYFRRAAEEESKVGAE